MYCYIQCHGHVMIMMLMRSINGHFTVTLTCTSNLIKPPGSLYAPVLDACTTKRWTSSMLTVKNEIENVNRHQVCFVQGDQVDYH